MSEETPPDAFADLDTMACGDLMIALRRAMRPLDSGQVLRVHATDPGAPHDIPAWCRMTGHTLLGREGDAYHIRKRDDPDA